ncbi:TetR family transcriptional regulator [Cupriavidus necator]|uniref:TetR family transcriptional regulator n=1 Tax=Cupriavidus necator TaxID=106590 RepID=A0A1U9UNE3_CUPNE|nr:TetR/AcrR family transcriptional regulator [Cupriavidus necator]AQV94168.1 TetR family transcriptional regulator [Cupriavidus necator]
MARPQEFNTAEALHEAMGVFWEKGYEATSLADLLTATGLSKSSLYATFGGKRELFIAAFDAYRDERTREMHRVLGQGPARHAIEQFFRMIIEHAGAQTFCHGCMSTNQAVELAPHDPEIRQRVEEDFQCIEDALALTIERGKREGAVPSSADTRALASLLVVAFPGFQVMVRAGAGHTRMESALRLLLSNLG